MDCCGGGPDDPEAAANKAKNKDLEAQLKKARKAEEEEIKLLLLGAGESGKSTIFKQFQILFRDGYSQKDKLEFKEVVHANTVQSMKALLNAMKKLGIPLDAGHEEAAERIEHMESSEFSGGGLSAQCVADIKDLWNDDSGVHQAFERRAEFQLNDSAEYFFKAIERITAADYIPDEQDVLRARVKTTGIVEAAFKVDDTDFKVFDVGGQRSERRKWIHCFEDVTAVIFIVGMSEYDQVLYEDETQNRMKEALDLFDEICNSRWFEKTSFILFLNKNDLFEQKIKKKDLNTCFPDYTGGCNYDKALEFISEQFKKLNHQEASKQVYIRPTCATDTENVKFVFNAVKDIILQDNMRNANII